MLFSTELAATFKETTTESDDAQVAALDLNDPGGLGTALRPLEEAARDRPGRRGHPVSYYLLWALRYVQAVDAGSASPNRDLAEQYDVPVGQVTQIISAALNKHGLLTKTEQGRPGGRLTAKGEKLRDQFDAEMQSALRAVKQDEAANRTNH